MKGKKGVWRRKEREADVGSIEIRNMDNQFIRSTSFNSCVYWHLNRAKFINLYCGTYINFMCIYIYIFIYGNNENNSGDSFSAHPDTFW